MDDTTELLPDLGINAVKEWLFALTLVHFLTITNI